MARAACPLACGACEPDVCASSPCLNGGTCTQGRDSATCKTSDLADRAGDVAHECCDEPTEDCSSGQPASCNPGCAAVLVPYYLDCRETLRAEPGGGEVLAAVQAAVQQCDSTPVFQCTCRVGYSGDNCEVGVSRFFAASRFRSPRWPARNIVPASLVACMSVSRSLSGHMVGCLFSPATARSFVRSAD